MGWFFTNMTMKGLKGLDLMVREACRNWLKWPKDAPKGLFLCGTSGGLGLPCLEENVPILIANRFENLRKSSDPLVKASFDQEPLRTRAGKAKKVRKKSGVRLKGREDSQRLWKAELDRSVDGRGLANHGGIKPHDFVWSGSSSLTGSEFVSAFKIRGNLVKTRGRSSRGRPSVDPNCECCKNQYESFAHILQVCPRAHGSRVARHDRVVDSIESEVKRKSEAGKPVVLKELRVPTPEGILKPDLIIGLGEKAFLIDVQVVADNSSLKGAHDSKIEYYDKPAIKEFALSRLQLPGPVTLSSVTFTWRGEIANESVELLEKDIGLTRGFTRMFCLWVLVGGLRIRRHFEQSTFALRQ